jgi:alanyl aminopeptidase
VTKVFGDRAAAIGWKPKAGEDNDTRLLRPHLLRLVTAEGTVPALRDEARDMARAWMKDRNAVSNDVMESLLYAAANVGDEELFAEYVATAQTARTRRNAGGC